ncbi:MAG: tRNA dihydrouridine synthase DusB [Candidatus Omnitrophica bacterium]|nr:tRNA dihydrouridine synthase DusB [Candidatus Omnitrophota bacterium]
MIRLKTLELPTVVQSPMANCTDLPFRLIARAAGMRFAFLEMISSEALVRNVQHTYEMMRTLPEDRPVGAQLVGCHPEVMGEAAATLEAMGFDLVDLNLGCPVPKIVSHGGGSMLLREPGAAEKIFRRVVRAVQRVPVTVKMRLGFRDGTGAEAAQIARIAQECGVDAVAVHGRTREQGYAGAANYEAIRRVKEAVSIPVIGNGDVVDAASARRLLDVSGCDGVMIGRGALGNPWIYRQIEAALQHEAAPPLPDMAQLKTVVLRHMDLQEQYDHDPVGPLRRIVAWYFRTYPGAAAFRDRVHRAQTVNEMRALVQEF